MELEVGMNQELPLTTKGPATQETSHSVRGKLWWLLPPAAALFYPEALRAFYESGKLLHRASGLEELAAWLAILLSFALVNSVPVMGIIAAYLLGSHERTYSSELRVRRFAHLVVASPSLFVLIGVVFYLLNFANGDLVFWRILWLSVFAITAWSVRRPGAQTTTSSRPNTIPLRVAHGTSALLVVLTFLAWHLLNHATAAFSPESNQAMMSFLRKWYRSEVVQPALVALMLFQVVTGVLLFRRATATRSDIYRTLQTTTGSLLTAFILSHLNAVFILGRAVTKVDTTFLWASGAPVGLLPDAWNVRLIPHYSLGVWFVIAHLGLGLRSVLLFHRVAPAVAHRVAWSMGALGAVIALTITVAQLSVHTP